VRVTDEQERIPCSTKRHRPEIRWNSLVANRKRGVALSGSVEQSISFKKTSRRLTTIDSEPYEAVENSLGPTLP